MLDQRVMRARARPRHPEAHLAVLWAEPRGRRRLPTQRLVVLADQARCHGLDVGLRRVHTAEPEGARGDEDDCCPGWLPPNHARRLPDFVGHRPTKLTASDGRGAPCHHARIADPAFQLPPILRTLFERGHVDYWNGRRHAELTARERNDRIAASAHHVLWWRGIEWDIELREIGTRRPDEESFRPGLVHFAGDGHGNRYSFHPRWSDAGRVPVIFCRHDELHSEVFARDIDECLVRCLLEHQLHPEIGEDEETRSDIFASHRRILRDHVGPAMAEVLDRLPPRPSLSECETALDALVASIPVRELVAIHLPTVYEEGTIAELRGLEGVIDAYVDSERYFKELVEIEGRAEHATDLETVQRRLATLRRDGVAALVPGSLPRRG